MNEIYEWPPNIADIRATFKLDGKSVIFAWGAVIYNPWRVYIPLQLLAHEGVHGMRQGGDIEGWWRRYLGSVGFRLDEEVMAHRAEYEVLMRDSPNRQARRTHLKGVAKRLASPLYGRMITVGEAKRLLVETT